MQQFREEESKKFQALIEELMAAFAGRTETTLVQTAAESIDQSDATPTVEKSVVPNVSETPSFQIAAKSIDPSESAQRVEKSVTSNVSETPSAQTAAKSIIPVDATPIVEKSATKTPSF